MQPNSGDMTEFYHEYQTSAQNQIQQMNQVQPGMMTPGGQIIVQQAGGGGGGAVAAIVVIVVVVVVAVTIVLAGVLYVWASSLAAEEPGGSLDFYSWDGRDAYGSMSDDGGDALVEVTMNSGDALNWAVVKVTIKVDGGTPLSCAEDDSTAACYYTPYQGGYNDRVWEISEGITIYEGDDTDLCDGYYGGCNVEVTITKVGVGNEDDKVIGTVNAYADANA